MSFGGILRQSTAVNVIIGPFVDSTDGDSEETGLTIAQADVRLSKNAAADAQKNDATSAAHEGDGFYMCELDTTDTNTVGQLTLWVHVAGALAVRHDFQVVEEAVYDALYAASAVGYVANAPVNVAQFGGANGTFASGIPAVNATQLSGDATAADNAEAFFDGTGYAGTGNTIPTVTTLTNAPSDPSGVTTLLSRLGTPSNLGGGATVAANLADIEAQTDDIGAAGAGLTAADDAILTAIGALNNLSAAQVNAEVDAALVDIHLDHLLAATYDPASKPGAADALLNELVESDGGVARYTANALEQAPSGGGGVADWTADERTAIRSILGIPGTGTTPDDPATGILDTIRDAVGVVDGVVDSILVDTAEIGAAGAGLTEAGGTGDHLTAVPWNAAWDAEVQSEATDALNAYDPPTRAELTSDTNSVLAVIATVDTVVDSILADTGTDGVVVAAGSKTGYSIGTGGIAAAAFAAGAVDAAAIAADAIGASELAAGAASEIATAVLTAAASAPIDANVKEVNDTALTGNGTSGTPWGPA